MKSLFVRCLLFVCAVPAVAQEPDIVQHVQRGEALAAQGRLEPAIVEYEKALAAGGGSALFLNRLGALYLEGRQFDKALLMFQRSLREKPGQLPVYSKLGETFLALGKLDSAISYVQQARSLAPEASSIHSSLAFLYLQGGDSKLAKVHLDTALQLDPGNPEAHRYLGFFFTQNDSLERAIEHYQKIVQLVPDHFEAYNNIAFLYAQQGRYGEALEYYEMAKERAEEPFLIYGINDRMEAVRAIMAGKMRARYILVKNQAEAVDLRRRVLEGEDFAQLARQFSQAPNAQDGGDLDFFGRGDLLPAFEEAVMQLKVGELSGVVEVPVGYLIIERLN